MAAGQSDDEGEEDEQLDEDEMMTNGMMEPKDLVRTNFEGDHEQDEAYQSSSDEEEMEEYQGEEPLSDEDWSGGDSAVVSGAEVGPAAMPQVLSRPGHGGHEKQYHLSHEWQQLMYFGEHLL